MQKLHLAQVGVGYWGPNLVRNFLRLPEVGRFTIFDTAPERVKAICQDFPTVQVAPTFVDILGDPTVDAVAVALPAELHFEYAKRALEAGKHVFVEKPFAKSEAEAKILARLARERGKTLMVGHTFLFSNAVAYVKDYLDRGELGDLYYILCERLNLGKVRQDVNAWWNLAPHDVSIILHWLGEEPSSFRAAGFTFVQPGIADVVFANLNFPSGRGVNIHVSWLHPNKSRKITLVGSKKMIVYDDVSTDAKVTIYDKGIDKTNISTALPEIQNFGEFQLMHRFGDVVIPKIDQKEPVYLECRHFVECVLTGRTPICDAENGLRVVRVLEQVDKLLQAQR